MPVVFGFDELVEGIGGAGGEHRADRNGSKGDPGHGPTSGQEARGGGEDDEGARGRGKGREGEMGALEMEERQGRRREIVVGPLVNARLRLIQA